MDSTPGQRLHLTLTSDGHPVMSGWWDREATARRKLASWVGSYGQMPDARVTLTDEVTGATLTSWPDDAPVSAMLTP